MRIHVMIRSVIAAILALLSFVSLSTPSPVAARVVEGGLGLRVAPPTSNFPPLSEFIRRVKNDQAGIVVGVYVPRVLALPVFGQPETNPVYVTSTPNSVTQFIAAARSGTIGLLAHNYLSGELFFKLSIGQEVHIVYGDGAVRRYLVSVTRRFQALSPEDPYSTFVDLDHDGVQLSSTLVFQQIYAGGDKVVFQTCIQADGDPSWGRLFVIATPVQ